MKRMICLILLVVLISLSPRLQCLADDISFRFKLENIWKNYLQASKSGKEVEFEKAASSFLFATLKNNLASAGRTMSPEMIESIAESAPDISNARFVKVLEKGPTAGLVYVKDAEWKDATGKPRVEFIFLKFVKEKGDWKVGGGMTVGGYKFAKNGKENEFDASTLTPPFLIDGKVPETPKAISIPEVSGYLEADSYGYKTQVTVNGIEQKTTVNQSSSSLIKGGMRYGSNDIVIQFTRVVKEDPFKPTVKIRRILADNEAKECFSFEPKENIEGTHPLSFTIRK